MFGVDLEKMTDKEIDDICDVIKHLGRPSVFKILRECIRNTDKEHYYTRSELNKIAGLTNVNKDKKFLVEHGLLKEIGENHKFYIFENSEKTTILAQCSKAILLKFNNKPCLRD